MSNHYEIFNIRISYIKALLLSDQQWTLYAIFGMIEHAKKIIDGDNSLATNLFGLLRQITIATKGTYTRGGMQILEQLTSDKQDVAKIGEGIRYILKGMGCRYHYPFIGDFQSLVSSYRAFFTPIRVQHYTPSTVYDELTEIPKQIVAIIDMTLGMNTARRAARTRSGGSDMDCSILVLVPPISYSLQHDYDGIVDEFNIYSLFRRTRYYFALFKYPSSSHN
jgi:hypothetical protein